MSETSHSNEQLIDPRTHLEVVKTTLGLVDMLIGIDAAEGNQALSVLRINTDSNGNRVDKLVYEMDAKIDKGWVGEYFGKGLTRLVVIAPKEDDPDQVVRLISATDSSMPGDRPKTLIPLREQQPIVSSTLTPEAPTDAQVLTQAMGVALLADLAAISAMQQ